MSKAEYNNFGQKLAFHSAPTLLGIKCASLISLSSTEFDLDFIYAVWYNGKNIIRGND